MRYLARLPDEPLGFHITKVGKLMERMTDKSNVPMDSTISNYIGLFHDIGKYTKYFQKYLISGEKFGGREHHAFISSVIFYYFLKNLNFDTSKLIFSAFLAVRHHHSNLSKVEIEFNTTDPLWYKNARHVESQTNSILKAEKEIIKFYPEGTMETIQKIKNLSSIDQLANELENLIMFNEDISLYFTTNLLLGMLVDADTRAVIDMPANEERKEIPENIVDHYLENLSHNQTHPIDTIRKEFYSIVINNIKSLGQESKFLSLTAPTGIGKTLAGFSAATRWRNMVLKETGKMPRIIYVLPFTSIIDQNYDAILKVIKHAGLSENILLKHHYRATPSDNSSETKVEDIWKMLEENSTESKNFSEVLKTYEQAHNRTETWDGEIIVTTFVRFYETLFTNRRSEMRRLHRLAGSIVILDEVQNIPAEYWQATEETLKFLADEWDTRFILMTATKPALFQNIPELVEPKKQHFFNKMSRTELFVNPEPVPYDEIERWLLPKIESEKSFMVILNTVRAAQEVYKALKEKLKGFELYFLTASLIPIHREKRIQEVKTKLEQGKKTGLISTQVVEAGVDLDFDIVIKDLAPLDSIIQAAGRCNRNYTKEVYGKVYLVNLTEKSQKNNQRELATYIYSGSLIDATKRLISNKNHLVEKEYLNLVEEYFRQVSEIKAQDKNLLDSITYLNYDELFTFSLIEEKVPQVPVFVEFDEGAVWIIKSLEKIESIQADTYEKRMERKQSFKTIQPELWKYVVNVPVDSVKGTGLDTLPYAKSFLWLRKEGYRSLEEIYDEETGFCRNIGQKAIFL